MSQPEQRDEVRIADYASRIVRRWYVVVACIVVAMLLVTLRTSTGGNRYQSQTTIFVGQPLTPTEGGTIPSTVVSNPTTAATFVRSQPVIFKAAHAAGIKPVALHARTSVVVLAGGSAVKAALANANIQITVLGATTWSRDQVQTATRSLGDQLIVWANTYQHQKSELLRAQIVMDTQSLATLQRSIDGATNGVKAIARSGGTPAEKAAASAPLLATISDAGSRYDDISNNRTTYQLYLAAATTVESADYVQEPSAKQVTASSRRSSLIVAAFVGLIVGVLLALVWDAIRNRTPRVREA